MEKNKNTQLIVIAMLSFAILFMTVGFAAYASTLNINGTATVSPTKWSVHFVNGSYAESTGSVAATDYSVTDNTVTYTVTLDKPGDFYEFTVNVINDGNFDATLKALTMSTLTAEQAKYLTYTVDYDGHEYNASQSSLSYDLPYAAGSNTVPVKVKLTYVQPENSADLPATAATVTLTAALDYQQK